MPWVGPSYHILTSECPPAVPELHSCGGGELEGRRPAAWDPHTVGSTPSQAPPCVSVCLAAKRVDMISMSPPLLSPWLCARGFKSGCRRFSGVSLDPRRASRFFRQHLRFSKGHTNTQPHFPTTWKAEFDCHCPHSHSQQELPLWADLGLSWLLLEQLGRPGSTH